MTENAKKNRVTITVTGARQSGKTLVATLIASHFKSVIGKELVVSEELAKRVEETDTRPFTEIWPKIKLVLDNMELSVIDPSKNTVPTILLPLDPTRQPKVVTPRLEKLNKELLNMLSGLENASDRQLIEDLLQLLLNAEHDAQQWKANHDYQVKIAKNLKNRSDIPVELTTAHTAAVESQTKLQILEELLNQQLSVEQLEALEKAYTQRLTEAGIN